MSFDIVPVAAKVGPALFINHSTHELHRLALMPASCLLEPCRSRLSSQRVRQALWAACLMTMCCKAYWTTLQRSKQQRQQKRQHGVAGQSCSSAFRGWLRSKAFAARCCAYIKVRACTGLCRSGACHEDGQAPHAKHSLQFAALCQLPAAGA
jgi:hypothetical protein